MSDSHLELYPPSANSHPSQALGRQVLDTIQSRRSIREGFINRPIPPNILNEIIQSGLAAPSSKNAQPWRLHVVNNRETLNTIADVVQSAKSGERYTPINPTTGNPRQWSSTTVESAQVLREVSVGLFVENEGAFSGGRQAVINADATHRNSAVTGYGFEMIGLGAAIQNMWLSAHAQGIEGVFMGDVAVVEPYIRKSLRFRGDLVGVLALGYTVQPPHPKSLKENAVIYHHSEEKDE